MQDRDFSKYYVVEDDGMIWLNSSKDWDGTTPVFPTQEAFIDAFAQSTDQYLNLNCLDTYKYRLNQVAEGIISEYGNKTEEELREDMLYAIMTDDISEIELREKVNQVTQEELKSREITLDTKGQFPTKL